ncbi:DUF4465 domain-containing protein [uncultured Muribaculum sp.]|uniref:DUF4465 domain-containing protein n=1 Tax=uncultured Muribaculum sp. TaxID=1918613 RepID=UPI0025FF80FB|nr:DUF4465 domain-containing protein [uncultured Muribaculum sp.]
MNRIIIPALSVACALIANAQSDIITLDLTKATTELKFDAETGAWAGTYDDDAQSIDSQCFSFVHNSMGEYKTWWGFTASNSADNTRRDDTIKFQFSNMAKGGICLNDDGTVMTDENGMPVVSADVPYLVSYANKYYGQHPADMAFNDGKAYEAIGVYVNLNSYPYYCIEYGDAFARAFHNGDRFTLTIHGIAPDNSEKAIDVDLASYTNGDLTINRGWKYVDLTSLGVVNEIYFSLVSTDAAAWGDNTPDYFCLDKLMVKPTGTSAISSVNPDDTTITYDRASRTVSIGNAGFAAVYDTAGQRVMASDSNTFSIASLSAGVYIIKARNSNLKIVK